MLMPRFVLPFCAVRKQPMGLLWIGGRAVLTAALVGLVCSVGADRAEGADGHADTDGRGGRAQRVRDITRSLGLDVGIIGRVFLGVLGRTEKRKTGKAAADRMTDAGKADKSGSGAGCSGEAGTAEEAPGTAARVYRVTRVRRAAGRHVTEVPIGGPPSEGERAAPPGLTSTLSKYIVRGRPPSGGQAEIRHGSHTAGAIEEGHASTGCSPTFCSPAIARPPPDPPSDAYNFYCRGEQ